MHTLTDDGNAKRFIEQFGTTVRYNRAIGWLRWTGTHWKPDPEGVMRMARVCARTIAEEAITIDDEKFAKKVRSWGHSSLMASRLESMTRIAKCDASIWVEPENLNRNPCLLNCPNGTIDLRTGHLCPHKPSDLITQIARVNFDNEAKCPRWMQFLGEIQSPAVIQSLQLMAGYSLTGLMTERAMFIPYGTGANGKSVFLDTFMHILGDYATSLPASTIMRQQYDTRMVMNYMATLHGRRFVHASEADASQHLSEQAIKTVTGDQTLTAEMKYKDPFSFTPTFKLWLATNHKPRITGTDNAIWTRIRLIPFSITIENDQQDPFLLQYLEETESEGILQWAVLGCLAYLKCLSEKRRPEMAMEIADATDEYKSEQDILGSFIEDNLLAKNDSKVSSSGLYKRYQKWCENNGHRPMSNTKMSIEVKQRGIKKHRFNDGIYWMNIQLANEDAYSSYDPF